MIIIKDILHEIEQLAPLNLQEDYDNAGIQIGDIDQPASGALVCLDITEAVIDEAIAAGCNLIIAHHPLAFRPFKSLTGKNYIERCMIKACQNDIVIYAAHTNLDNAVGGINYQLAELFGLDDVRILSPQKNKLYELFAQVDGRAAEQLLKTLLNEKNWKHSGSGIIGKLPEEKDERVFLQHIKDVLHVDCLRHSSLTGRPIRTVAIGSGNGAFLLSQAIAAGADIFITGEAKYNDFYDVENMILLAVTGHYESEICAKDIFFHLLSKKFPTFAVQNSIVNSNPIKYF